MDIRIIVAIVVGIAAGILINYLANVLPYKRKLTEPFCLNCDAPLRWADFLFYRKCPKCGHRPAIRYLLVVAASTLASVILWVSPPDHLNYIGCVILFTYLGLIAVIDLEHRLVLHITSLAGIVIGLFVGFQINGVRSTLIGGAAGFAAMLLLYYLGALFGQLMAKLRGQEIEEVALGFGDVNISGVLGLIVGWPSIWVGLLCAILLGGIVSLLIILAMLAVRKYKPFTAIPYAPFLIIGSIVLVYLK